MLLLLFNKDETSNRSFKNNLNMLFKKIDDNRKNGGIYL